MCRRIYRPDRSHLCLRLTWVSACLPTCCRCSPFANTYSVAPFVRVALGFGVGSGGIRFQFLIILYQCGLSSCSTTSVSTTYSSSSDRILKLHQMRWWGTVGQWSVSSRLTSRGEEQMSDIPTCPIFVIIIQLFLWVTLGYVTDSASGASAVSVLTVILWMMCGSWCFPSPRSSSVNNSTDLQFDGSIITEEKKNKRNKRSDSTTVLNCNAPTDWDGWTRCDEMRDRWWL